MEKVELVISLAGTAVTFLTAAVTFLVKFIKSVKEKLAAENVVKICNAVLPFIARAEEFVHYTGAEKKEFVMTKANQYAIEHGIVFDAELVGEKVEELVRLTKDVNKREQSSQAGEPVKTQLTLSR